MRLLLPISILFFFNDTATTEIYTLSLHDALPISPSSPAHPVTAEHDPVRIRHALESDRKSTRLNSSHQIISYAVFCLKKKKNTTYTTATICSSHNCTLFVVTCTSTTCSTLLRELN